VFQLLLRGFFTKNFIFRFFNIYFLLCFEGFYNEIARYKLDIEVTHQEQKSVFVFSWFPLCTFLWNFCFRIEKKYACGM
jgi:hypothetical protein